MTVSASVEHPILIIDDDEDAHFFLIHDLKKLGVTTKIDSAMDGRSGVTYLKRCQRGESPFPALVFLDVKMPVMDGFEVLTWVREQQLLGAFSLAMLTSSDDPSDIQRAFSLGAHTYLTKPPTPAVLEELVRTSIKLAKVAAALHLSSVRTVEATPVPAPIVGDSTSAAELKQAVEHYEALFATYTKVREELIVRRRGAADHVMVEIDQRLEVNARAIEAFGRAAECARKYLLVERKEPLP